MRLEIQVDFWKDIMALDLTEIKSILLDKGIIRFSFMVGKSSKKEQ